MTYTQKYKSNHQTVFDYLPVGLCKCVLSSNSERRHHDIISCYVCVFKTHGSIKYKWSWLVGKENFSN